MASNFRHLLSCGTVAGVIRFVSVNLVLVLSVRLLFLYSFEGSFNTYLIYFILPRLRNHNATDDDNVDFRSFRKILYSKHEKLMQGSGVVSS